MKTNSCLIRCYLGVLLMGLFVGDAWASTMNTGFSPGNVDTSAGSVFNVDLVATSSDTVQVSSWDFDVIFNSSFLELVSAVGGPGFDVFSPDLNRLVGLAFPDPVDATAGTTFTLATLTFRGLAAGTTTLALGALTDPPQQGAFLLSSGYLVTGQELALGQGLVTIDQRQDVAAHDVSTISMLAAALGLLTFYRATKCAG